MSANPSSAGISSGKNWSNPPTHTAGERSICAPPRAFRIRTAPPPCRKTPNAPPSAGRNRALLAAVRSSPPHPRHPTRFPPERQRKPARTTRPAFILRANPPSRTSPVSSGFPTLSMSETPSDARQPADAPPPNPHPSTNAPDRQSDNRASSHKTKSVEDPLRLPAGRIAEMSDERHHRPASGRTRLQNPPEASAVPPGNDCGGPVKGRRISYGRRIAYFR